MKGCKALWGASYGIDMHFRTSTVYVENFTAEDIDAASTQDLDKWNNNPTTPPDAVGIRVESTVSKVDIEKASIQMGKASKDAMKMQIMNDSTVIL